MTNQWILTGHRKSVKENSNIAAKECRLLGPVSKSIIKHCLKIQYRIII
jgi:hypothetical protein